MCNIVQHPLHHGTFKPPSYVTAEWTGQPNQIVIADLNGDGNADLAITDWWENSVYLFAGNGDGTFGPQVQAGGRGARAGCSALTCMDRPNPVFGICSWSIFCRNGTIP